MTAPGLTQEGERGHRRGVVMGLTMAEVMLLLLFCLLLASAGIVEKQGKALEAAKADLRTAQRLVGDHVDIADVAAMERELETLKSESRRLHELVSAEEKADPVVAIPDETWRELELSAEAGKQIISAGVSVAEVIDAVKEIRERPASPASVGPGTHDWPPIITLGNDEFRFPINSAELSVEFEGRLTGEVANDLRNILATYDVDVIEVVGHTDESPVASTRLSTMDENAIGALSGRLPMTELVPADNVGLGMARAIAVSNSLNVALSDLKVKVIPLSAAQLVMPGDLISTGLNSGNDPSRRRIEIRVRKSSQEQAP